MTASKESIQLDNDYKAMVRALSKPGRDIVSDLTDETAHIWHMATGIVGESFELMEGVEKADTANVREEFGDLEFYVAGMRQVVDPVFPVELDLGDEIPYMALLKKANDVLEYTKKMVVYQKYYTALNTSLGDLIIIMQMMYVELGLNQDEIRKGNMDKLCKGANARYASGAYSNKQAQERADKQ